MIFFYNFSFLYQEGLNSALQLTGKLIKGRAISIKLSTRNITRNKKRTASTDLESEMNLDKKQKLIQ